MENKTFTLASNSISYDLIFENGKVAASMIRKLKECHLDEVTKVVQKKTTMGLGDEISFRIYFYKDGKEQRFPWIQARVNEPSTKACLDYMKEVFPSTVEWTDQRGELKRDESGRTVCDLQYLLMGYAGAGLSRGFQLWLYMITLGILVLPLIYFATILATGGYRAYFDEMSFEVKKLGSKKWNWKDIASVHLTNVNVVSNNNISGNHVMRFVVTGNDGKKSKFVMRYDHAVPLLKEMAKHDLVAGNLVEQFA